MDDAPSMRGEAAPSQKDGCFGIGLSSHVGSARVSIEGIVREENVFSLSDGAFYEFDDSGSLFNVL